MTWLRGPDVRCGCGRGYSLDEWSELEFCGVWDSGDDTTDDIHFEMRHCKCGSTISMEMVPVVLTEDIREAHTARAQERRAKAYTRWRMLRTPGSWRWLMAWDAVYHDAVMGGY